MDASADSSGQIYPRCHGFEDKQNHQADFIEDAEQCENPESSEPSLPELFHWSAQGRGHVASVNIGGDLHHSNSQ